MNFNVLKLRDVPWIAQQKIQLSNNVGWHSSKESIPQHLQTNIFGTTTPRLQEERAQILHYIVHVLNSTCLPCYDDIIRVMQEEQAHIFFDVFDRS